MIKFDSVTHTYSDAAGKLPSVSEILSTVFKIDTRFFTPESAERGKWVHDHCNLIDRGIIKRSDVVHENAGYLDAYERFGRENPYTVIDIEKVVCNKYLRYAGRLDRIIEIDGKNILVDLKTGQKQKYHKLQGAAYRMAYQDITGSKIDSVWMLYLNKKGTYKVEHCGDPVYMDYWKACRKLYDFMEFEK
jgi:hypothetical protein